MKRNMLGLLAFASTGIALAGVHNIQRSTAPDRVKTPLVVDMKRLGTLKPRCAFRTWNAPNTANGSIAFRLYLPADALVGK